VIEFMVLGAPRSATAWAANWLTTDTTLCLHEPLARWAAQDLDGLSSPKMLGISCTALALRPDFVNAHPARKVILHRPSAQISASMDKLRIPGSYDFDALDRINGMHVPWTALFRAPEAIYAFLLQRPFDVERHTELISLNIQNMKLIRELQRAS
jgi:hypothetical protein